MGFSRFQTLRLIKIPQMLRFSVPGMVNELTTVLKYSPFAYTVGLPEITKQGMALVAMTLRGIEIYVAIGIGYGRVLLVGDDDAWGDEMNIACKLGEDLAERGEDLVSNCHD